MYTVEPMFIPADNPFINGPVSNICIVFEEWLLNMDVLRVSIARKISPFIYALYSIKDIHRALQMPDGLLSVPSVSRGDGARWPANNNIIDFLNLYPEEYIEELASDDVALNITYDDLLTDGFLLNENLPLEIYYCSCTPERLKLRRVIDVFFMKSLANYYTRVRIEVPVWANFDYIYIELLKGACSRNCIPISFNAQYTELYSQLTAASPRLIQHGKGYNKSKSNNYIDAVIYIPDYEGDHIFATQLYCLWLNNRIPIMDGKPLFRTFANNLKEHFLMPYYSMEDHLLRDVHCILIDNRDHPLRALKAKVQRQYDKLPPME
jgi:hypothetical protein